MRLLLVPGGGNSGPDHWHTYWEAQDPCAERVVQADWETGRRVDWVAALDRSIQASDEPAVLAAHSLGAITAVHWAAAHHGPVIGAMLVGPADVEGEWVTPGSIYEGFQPIPMNPLPFPSLIVASTNDPYLSLKRAQEFASAWGSKLENVGALQHIGSECKLEGWPEGRRLLEQLLPSIR